MSYFNQELWEIADSETLPKNDFSTVWVHMCLLREEIVKNAAAQIHTFQDKMVSLHCVFASSFSGEIFRKIHIQKPHKKMFFF